MKTKVQNQLIVFGIVVLLFGLAFVGLGLHVIRSAEALQTRGVKVPAQITGASTDSNKGNKRYILTVQWTDGQAPQSRKFVVEEDFFRSKVGDGNVVTSADTTVTQIPGEPGTAVVEGGTTTFKGAHWGGAVVVLIGIAMLYKGCTGRAPKPPVTP